MIIFYFIVGVVVFWGQCLLGKWFGAGLDLMMLLVIHVSFHAPLFPAMATAILLGLFIDCYSNTPLGLHAMALLLAVFAIKLLRSKFNLGTFMPQVLATLAVMLISGVCTVGLISMLEPVKITDAAVLRAFFTRSLITAAVAPPALSLFSRLDKSWGRHFFRAPVTM